MSVMASAFDPEYGEAWTIQGVSWTPLPAAQSENENQQFGLYGVMLLTSLKDTGTKVTETAPGKDGTHNLHVEHAGAPPVDLRFDAPGRGVIAFRYGACRDAPGAPWRLVTSSPES